ncbi:MAG: hypothetical protein IJS56_05195 [Bacilli bacterium]|nr:hypothetical protein [Bacilli bacterium]
MKEITTYDNLQELHEEALSYNIKTINNNNFSFHVEKNGLSSLSAGYLITPDGNVIKVFSDEEHTTILRDYLNKFLENEIPYNYELYESLCLLLNEYNHIIYYGVKEEHIRDMYANQGNTAGCGQFFIPDELCKVNEIQENIIKEIINSNYSFLSGREILPLKYQSTSIPTMEPIDKLIEELNNIKRVR